MAGKVLTMKVREKVAGPLTFADRLRILWTGRIYVYIRGAREHTEVVLATRRAPGGEDRG